MSFNNEHAVLKDLLHCNADSGTKKPDVYKLCARFRANGYIDPYVKYSIPISIYCVTLWAHSINTFFRKNACYCYFYSSFH